MSLGNNTFLKFSVTATATDTKPAKLKIRENRDDSLYEVSSSLTRLSPATAIRAHSGIIIYEGDRKEGPPLKE